jgi:hypothetical protein
LSTNDSASGKKPSYNWYGYSADPPRVSERLRHC